MSAVADQVIVEMIARLDKAEADIRRYGQTFDKTMRGVEKSGGRAEKFMSAAASRISGAMAGVSVVALATGFLNLADRSKQLQAQLKLATRDFGNLGQAQQDAERIAAVTRSGIEATTTLYSAFIRNSGQLGASQEQAARATESFAKILKIGGASASEAGSATLQFGQALASGALRGDEFNSIAEASPRILKLLADAMNVPIGSLRKLAEEGKITSDVLFKALTDTKFTKGIDSEFQELPTTFGEAMQQVENAAIATFGAFDRGGQFSTMLANFITDGAEGFANLEDAAEKFGIQTRSELEGLRNAFEPLVSSGFAAFQSLDERAGQSADYIRDSLKILDTLTWAGANILNNLPQAPGQRTNVESSDFVGRYDKGKASAQRRLEAEARDRMIASRFSFGPGGLDGFLRNGLRGTPPKPAPRAAPSGAGGKKKTAPKSPLDPDAFDREEAGLNDAILRAKGDQVISAEERARIALQRIEGDRVQASEEINADKRFTADQKKKLIALSDSLASLQAVAVTDREKRRLAERSAELEADGFRREAEALEPKLALATTAKERRDLELRLLDLQYKEEDARLRALEASEDLVIAARARADREALGERKSGEASVIKDRTRGPLDEYLNRIPDTADEINEALEEIAVGGLRDVEDGFARAATEALGLKGALGSVVEQMIKLAFQQQLLNRGGGLLGGLGKLLGLASGVPGFSSYGSVTSSLAGYNPTFAPINFGGARALGGPASANTDYLVGENGPEILRMGSRAGFVIPNERVSAKAGGTTVVQPIHFDLRGAVMTADILQQMNDMAKQAGMAGAQAGGAIGEARVMRRAQRRIPM